MKGLVKHIAVFMALMSISVCSVADKGGVAGSVHTASGEPAPYSVRLGDITSSGVSVVGVARRGEVCDMLFCTLRADTAYSAVNTDWMGTLSAKSPYVELDNATDSLVLYTYTMGVQETDDEKLNSRLIVGKALTDGFCGKFAVTPSDRDPFVEYTIYGRKLSISEKRRLESHYAIKYGITLDQKMPSDYTSSDGTVVWSGTANRDFRYDVAGICNDSGSELDHRKSSGINTNHTPEISVTEDIKNGMYLMWSHNGASGLFGDMNEAGERRMEREWITSVTGNWSNVPVNVGFRIGGTSGLPILNEGETYSLRVYNAEDGAEAVVSHYQCSYVGKDEIVFENVNLSTDRTRFTVVATELGAEEERNPIQYVRLYPTPTKDGVIHIEIGLYEKGDANIIIYNSIGQTLATGTLSGSAYYGYDGFLPVQGTYLIIVRSGDGKSVNKVIRR